MRNLIALLSSLLLSASASAAPLRIMPIGDSITAGYTDNPTWNVPFNFGYRYPLYSLLTQAGYDFAFVGASPEPFNFISGDPTHGGTVSPANDLRTLAQNGHRGYGGMDINYFYSNIIPYLETDQPDVMLLMIGINGISSNSPAQLDALVGRIFQTRPQMRLIVAQITPLISYNADLYNYNTYIRTVLVPKYAAQGRKISTVDQYANFLTQPGNPASIDASKYANGINHPNQAGYNLMAATWFAGIQALPRAVSISTDRFPPSTSGGQLVALLNTTPAVATEQFAYSLVPGDGDADNRKFSISDGKLVAGSYPFALDPPNATYHIRVQSQSQAGGDPVVENFTLSLSTPAMISTFHSTNEIAYAADVSATDLLQGLTGDYVGFQSAGPGYRINDGIHGGAEDLTAIAWAARGNATSATYTLGAGPNGSGYDVNSITSIAAWNSAGFMNQKYQVSVRYSGDAAFTLLPDLAVDYQPVTNTEGAPNGEPGATKVVITSSGGGVLLHGVEQIRFSILDTVSNPAGGMVLREIDVQGAPSPAEHARILEIDPYQSASDSVEISWRSRAGETYRLESSTDLDTWLPLQAAVPSGGLKTSYTDTTAFLVKPVRRFFRVTPN